MPTKHMLLSILLGGIFFSCEQPTRHLPYVEPPTSDQFAFLPLYIGNEWAYVDSGYSLPFLTVFTVSNYLVDNHVGHWTISNNHDQSFLYTVQGDTVIVKPHGAYSPMIEYIGPSEVGDTLIFLRRYFYGEVMDGVRVYRTNASVAVPAGTFDSLVVYDSMGPTTGPTSFREMRYFKPGVGLIKTVGYRDTTLVFSRALVFYRLVR